MYTFIPYHWSVDNYLDEFVDLIAEAGYTDPKTTGEILKRSGPANPEHHCYDGLWASFQCLSRRLV